MKEPSRGRAPPSRAYSNVVARLRRQQAPNDTSAAQGTALAIFVESVAELDDDGSGALSRCCSHHARLARAAWIASGVKRTFKAAQGQRAQDRRR